MRNGLFLSLLSLIAISDNLLAGTVSVSDARQVASNFFKVNTAGTTTPGATLKYTKTETDNTVDFYVFDMSPVKGFVIVAADDRVIPILGYSTTGTFRTDFDHTGLSRWVFKTATNIHRALQSNVAADANINNQWSAYRQGRDPFNQRSGSVAPLCSVTWDQENDVATAPPFYYNLLCPYNNTDNQRALTGCVATAMAQIMKFWNYPAQGVGSFTYVDDALHGYSNNYGTLTSDFATHSYKWASMPTACVGTETVAQDSAVDVLMYDCAVSVGMDFGDDNQNGSGANALLATELLFGDSFCSQYAMVKYFSYDADTINGVFEASYTPSAWTTLIEHELNVGRPVLYEGNDPSQGGHAWVCDGYDVSNKLHMNWGWGGASDGYFAINNLTTPGNFNPIDSDDALIGIMPKHQHTTSVIDLTDVLSFRLYPNPASHDLVIQTDIINGGMNAEIKNMMGQTMISTGVEAAKTHIDISSLSDGIYLVELRVGGQSLVQKLVVSR